MNIQIKRLKPDEIDLAIDLIRMSGFTEGSRYQVFSSKEYVSQMLERNDFHVVIALENETLIGGLTAYEMKMFKRETAEMFFIRDRSCRISQTKGDWKILNRLFEKHLRRKKHC